MEAEDDARVSKSSLTLPIPPTLTKDTEQPKQFPQKQLKSKESTQHKIQPKLQKSKSTPQTFKRTNPEKAGEKEEKADEILENMESLQSNIQVQDLLIFFCSCLMFMLTSLSLLFSK